jgi:hypothetical protein
LLENRAMPLAIKDLTDTGNGAGNDTGVVVSDAPFGI